MSVEQEIKETIKKTANIIESLSREAEEAHQMQQSAVIHLNQQLSTVDKKVHSVLNQHVHTIRDEVTKEVQHGVNQGMSIFSNQLNQIKKDLINIHYALEKSEERIKKISQSLLLKVNIGLGASLVVILIAVFWLFFHYKNIIDHSQITADSLRKYQAAAIHLCGDKLCAKSMKTPASIKKEGYFLIAPKEVKEK